jgi:phosphopantothenoylcysteine decarboxylase
MKVLLGVTGSVAAKLTGKMVKKLKEAGHEVRVIATKDADYFFHDADVYASIYRHDNEFPVTKNGKYDPDNEIPHLELTKWADVFLIAPLSANTLAKMANGITDNLLTCAFRAWWPEEVPDKFNRKIMKEIFKPLIVAPAMNTRMWRHPATNEHIDKIRKWYDITFQIIPPISKKLACGETGMGAMADIADIVAAVDKCKKQ